MKTMVITDKEYINIYILYVFNEISQGRSVFYTEISTWYRSVFYILDMN